MPTHLDLPEDPMAGHTNGGCAERSGLAGRRALGRPDGSEHGGEHQPAGHRRRPSAAPYRWRSCSPRSASCWSPTASSGSASTSTTPARSTPSSASTLGPRTGVVAGWRLLGTYVFYGVVTSSATGIFGTAFLDEVGIWPTPAELGAVRPRRARARAGARADHRPGQARHEHPAAASRARPSR